MRRRAESRDADFFAAQILGPLEIAARDDSLHALVDDGANHYHVSPAKRRADHAAAATAEKLHVAGNKRAHSTRRCSAD